MSDTFCAGFKWVGQSFAHCDECGFAYWEHEFDEFRGVRTRITKRDAKRVREQWGES